MRRVALALVLCVAGCAKPSLDVPITYDTHKVWWRADSLVWQDAEYGLVCGRVDREDSGWVYSARVIDWTNTPPHHEPRADFNSFDDAVKFVERWCKP